jgi:hypothetical protein
MMPTERGFVEELLLTRQTGKVKVRPITGLTATFTLYSDGGVSMIDPTEMVRRNWMIGSLQQAAAHRLEVTITFPSNTNGRVQQVTLHTGLPKKSLFSFSITKGTVRRINVEPGIGSVTINGVTAAHPDTPPGNQSPVDLDFFIYRDDTLAPVSTEESNRRNRVVALLRQALAEGLQVWVTHPPEPNALIHRASLLA